MYPALQQNTLLTFAYLQLFLPTMFHWLTDDSAGLGGGERPGGGGGGGARMCGCRGGGGIE